MEGDALSLVIASSTDIQSNSDRALLTAIWPVLSLSNLRGMLMNRLPLIFHGMSAAHGDGGVVEGEASSSSTMSRA